MDLYVEWREQCAAVAQAYERWTEVPAPDRGLAFAAYSEALDREELASSLYAKRVTEWL